MDAHDLFLRFIQALQSDDYIVTVGKATAAISFVGGEKIRVWHYCRMRDGKVIK